MKRGFGGLCVFGVVAVAATAAPVAQPAPDGASLVRVIALRPFTIRGLHFRAAERVTVTVTLRRSHRHTLRASRAGTFVVRVAEDADACSPFNVRVVGSSGSRVTVVKRLPLGCAALGPSD